MTRWALLATLLLGCPSKPTATGGGGQGSGSAPVVTNAKTCDDVKGRVEALYRAEAQAIEPKRVDEAVADNTTMVLNDCAKDPATFVPCLAAVQSVAELEKKCLIPLDEEGTEADTK